MNYEKILQTSSINRLRLRKNQKVTRRYKPGIRGRLAALTERSLGIIGPTQYQIADNYATGKIVTSGLTKKEAKRWKRKSTM